MPRETGLTILFRHAPRNSSPRHEKQNHQAEKPRIEILWKQGTSDILVITEARFKTSDVLSLVFGFSIRQ
jgi:hypothetical protein